MSKKDKVYMPSGSGGLVRYGEEGDALIKLKPKQVAYVVAGIVIAELVLKFLF